VTPAQVVGSTQRHNLLVIEAHPVENVSEMVSRLGSIGQTTTRWVEGLVGKVGSAGLPGYVGAAHGLDGYAACQGPEVCVGDPGVLLLDGL
jgi:hypothetical protein